MLEDKSISDDFERDLRSLLPSIEIYRMRHSNNFLLISFGTVEDFLEIVRAAAGANVFMEVGWLFDSSRPNRFDVGSCFLKLQLSHNCQDERLKFIVDEIKGRKA